MNYLVSAIGALTVAVVANGLAWSGTRRRMSVLSGLVGILSELPKDHHAYSRISGDVDDASSSMSAWLQDADDRSRLRVGWTVLLGGQAAIFGAGILLPYVSSNEVSATVAGFRPYVLLLAFVGMLGVALGVLALVIVPLLRVAWRWRPRSGASSDGSDAKAASDASGTRRAEGSQRMTTDDSHDDAYLDHAVWLLEWHERRSEAFVTRSVGLLGFTGVLLAFVLQLVTRSGFEAGLTTYFALAAALGTLTASAWFALGAMKSQSVEAPGVKQLRDWWAKELVANGPGDPRKSIVERFLVGTNLGEESPLDSAAKAANLRAGRFECAGKLLFFGVAAIAVLVVDVTVQG